MSESDPTKPDRRRVGGRYALGERLGGGGQGTTWEAVDEQEGRLVAVKEFRVLGARSWKDVELAEREAEILAKLDHPLLPRYLDHFEEDGVLYLVMDRMAGQPMARGAKVQRCSTEEVLTFLTDVADVLDYLHRRAPPIIHRDIKPANVLRLPNGSFGLVDFGAVRAELRPEGGSTVVGTFGFMAPEQFQGRALPATDVYAVGATALTLLTGRPPETLPHRGLGIDVDAALAGHVLPSGLTQALARMLEPDPDKRATRIRPLLEGIERDKRRYRVDDATEPTPEPPEEARRQGAKGREGGRPDGRKPVDFHEAENTVHLPHVAVFGFRLGLLVLRLAVAMALSVVVPTLLVLLGIVFGPGLHRAARAVRGAGRRADAALARASRVVRTDRSFYRARKRRGQRRSNHGPDRHDAGPRTTRKRVADDRPMDAPGWTEQPGDGPAEQTHGMDLEDDRTGSPSARKRR